MSNRMEVKVLGIVLGTASGWDETTEWGLTFYDFEPVLTGIPSGDLYIDIKSGDLQVTDANNQTLLNVPAYGLLKQVVDHG